MKIKFYGYNAFLIESGDKKIAIDPGALFFYWFRFTTLIMGVPIQTKDNQEEPQQTVL